MCLQISDMQISIYFCITHNVTHKHEHIHTHNLDIMIPLTDHKLRLVPLRIQSDNKMHFSFLFGLSKGTSCPLHHENNS